MTPKGFKCLGKSVGIKETGKKDFALIVSEVPGSGAAVFTRSTFCGAPVLLGRDLIKPGRLQAFLVTSGVSNVATGQEGIDNARKSMDSVGAELGIQADYVLPSSTGVIGQQLPMDKILGGISGSKIELEEDAWESCAEAIMTTDTYAKLIRVKVGDAVLVGMAKGSGMIEPDMATMLSFWVTDADIPTDELQPMLKRVVDKSFNCVSIDSDTSTSDTVAMLANGMAGKVDLEAFEAAFTEAAVDLAKEIARDGEGATKLIEVTVAGAVDEPQARTMAKSILNSPLVKTALYGADANWGRVAMALGKTFDERLNPSKLSIRFGNHTVYADGGPIPFDEEAAEAELKDSKEVSVEVNLNLGNAACTVWGCDLTEEYIKINALYRT